MQPVILTTILSDRLNDIVTDDTRIIEIAIGGCFESSNRQLPENRYNGKLIVVERGYRELSFSRKFSCKVERSPKGKLRNVVCNFMDQQTRCRSSPWKIPAYSSAASITPGLSQVFEAEASASPGSASGIYPATLQISFSDGYGSAYNQTYSVSIMLLGSVIIIVQDEAFTQNATAITVTGNLLDEGSASAYYQSVYDTLNGSKSIGSSNYIGEVDPNTPVPFTLTIPYLAQGTALTGNITVISQFKNILGQSLSVSSSSTTPLESSSQISPTSSTLPSDSGTPSGPNIIELGIIFTIVLVVAGIGIFALIKRRENKRMTRPSPSNSGNRPGSVS